MAATTASRPMAPDRGPSGIGRKVRRYGLLYTVSSFFVVFAGIPFAWMVFTVFKQNTDLYSGKNNPLVYNDPPTTEHIRTLFIDTNYTTFLVNTLVVAVAVTLITIVIAVPPPTV